MSKFNGVFTALVTPFLNGEVDYESLTNLVKFQVENNVSGFVVNGTTAESPTLSQDEVKEIFKTVKHVAPQLPLVLGVGSNCTASTIENLKLAEELEADAVLVVVPYYNKPPQRGMLAHFKKVADASSLPIILYNVPGRTVVSMAPETVIELNHHKNIIGIKEASGDVSIVKELVASTGKDFLLSSGDDSTCIEFCQNGGKGVISVISHVIPKELSHLIASAAEQNSTSELYKKYDSLNAAMSYEANPIPVKMALYLMGIIRSPEMRLPLVELASQHTENMKQVLSELGLLKS